jgi:hypothetical protein
MGGLMRYKEAGETAGHSAIGEEVVISCSRTDDGSRLMVLFLLSFAIAADGVVSFGANTLNPFHGPFPGAQGPEMEVVMSDRAGGGFEDQIVAGEKVVSVGSYLEPISCFLPFPSKKRSMAEYPSIIRW